MLAIVFGCILTGINGAIFPYTAILFGDAISSFQPFDQAGVNPAAALQYFLLAPGLLFTDYAAYVAFDYIAENQMRNSSIATAHVYESELVRQT